MDITVKKQVLAIGTRYIAEIKYENALYRNYEDSLFRCPYKAMANLTSGMLEHLQQQNDNWH